jgi:hypothetical protein
LPPFNLFLVGVSFSKAPSPWKISTHVSPEFWIQMKECFPLGDEDTNHNLKDVENSNFSTCPSYKLCYMSLDLSIFRGFLEFQIWHPSENAQNGNTNSSKKIIQS